jgi:hypothetical protein
MTRESKKEEVKGEAIVNQEKKTHMQKRELTMRRAMKCTMKQKELKP